MGDNIELAQIEEGAPGAPNLVYGDEPTGDTDSESSDQEVMTIREGSPQEGVKKEVHSALSGNAIRKNNTVKWGNSDPRG